MSVALAKRRFVRVYYVDLERDYPAIFYDPTALSTWVRLLVASDKAWPTIAELPGALRRADLAKLTECGLLEIHEHRRYTLRGYVKERSERQALARKAVNARNDRNGTSDAASV